MPDTTTMPDAGRQAARPATPPAPPAPHPSDVARLLAGVHDSPHSVLGAHPVTSGGEPGVVVRAYHPNATGVEVVLDGGKTATMQRVEGGLFAVFLPDARLPLRYMLRFQFAGGATWEHDDPYRFLPTIGDIDLHLFNEGTHHRL